MGGGQSKLRRMEADSKSLSIQDKMRKVLEIWVKSGTFPPDTLDRLKFRVSPSQPPSIPGSSRSPGYANIYANGNGSTTPLGSPSAAVKAQFSTTHTTIDPNDGYAGYGAMDGGNGAGEGESLFPAHFSLLFSLVVPICVLRFCFFLPLV